MKKFLNRKNVIIFVSCLVLYFLFSFLEGKYLIGFNLNSFKISASLNPSLGIIFGWPAIIACCLGKAISNLALGYELGVSLIAILPYLVYGFVPFFTWRKYIKSTSHVTRLDTPYKVLIFIAIIVLNSLILSFFEGYVDFNINGKEYLESAFFSFINTSSSSIMFAIPIIVFTDIIRSKIVFNGRRSLCYNEKITLINLGAQLISFIVLIVVLNIVFSARSKIEVYGEIFKYEILISSLLTFISICVMFFIHANKRKHKGLRIVEKTNGTIFVDEKNKYEFVSYPEVPLKYRIKTSSKKQKGNGVSDVSYENAWYASLSVQKGCPMSCAFCDCPSYGYHGNLTIEDFKNQIYQIIENTGTSNTKLFAVDFSRCGEPTLNDNLLEFLEFDLIRTVSKKMHADVIIPTISTMMPSDLAKTKKFLMEYCRIKNEVYDGNAELQISVSSTDENVRKFIFGNKAMSLEDIAFICHLLPMPKGSKYYLTFPIAKSSIIDAKLINKLFDKNKFAIRFTPMHKTFNAIANGFEIEEDYETSNLFENFEKPFKDLGWDVFIYLDKKTQDENSLTDGNLTMANIRERLKDVTLVKKIGVVVAVEIEAVFQMYKNIKELPCPAGFKLYLVERDNYLIYFLHSNLGECAASAATQYLITNCGVTMIVNFGVTGGLTLKMKKLKVCLVNKVVHYKFDCSEFMDLVPGQVNGHDSIFIRTSENLVKNALNINPDLTLATCCSGDKFISTAQEKMYLHKTFKGDLCDMESAGILLTCEINQIPCVMFKAVSDGLADGAEGYFKELANASLKCLKIVDKMLDKLVNVEY